MQYTHLSTGCALYDLQSYGLSHSKMLLKSYYHVQNHLMVCVNSLTTAELFREMWKISYKDWSLNFRITMTIRYSVFTAKYSFTDNLKFKLEISRGNQEIFHIWIKSLDAKTTKSWMLGSGFVAFFGFCILSLTILSTHQRFLVFLRGFYYRQW